MAVPPTIPTSFVPRQSPAVSPRGSGRSFASVFFFLATVVFALSLIAAGAVFAYDEYLKSAIESRTSDLESFEKAVSPQTVEELVRLKDRLAISRDLLGGHVSLLAFFDLLELATLQNVRFSSLSFTLTDEGGGAAGVELIGVARSFNALAAQSRTLASDARVRDSIFRNIKVNQDGTIGFTLTATLDQRLVRAYVPSASTPEALPETPIETPSETL